MASAYRTLSLTLGELRVADELLSNPKKADLVTVRTHGEIRSSLQLRQSVRDLNKLNEKGLDLGVFPIVPTPQGPQPLPLQWDDMLDPDKEILARVQKQLDAKRAADDVPTEELASLEEYKLFVQNLLAARECALPHNALKALNSLIGKKDWTKARVRDRETGRVVEVDALVSPAQMDIFVSLADKVNLALTAEE
jgi:hypothetical protein